ncbi:hypothetical protein L2734_01270, partial [Parashewanella spongiae]|uniref:hypothetical protein n=1 Tax=Parashewanella spongiae TaxID=342950 RepID=UPI00200E8F0F
SYSTCKSYNANSSHFSKLVSVEHFTHWVKAMMIKSSYCSSSYRSTDVFRFICQMFNASLKAGICHFKSILNNPTASSRA